MPDPHADPRPFRALIARHCPDLRVTRMAPLPHVGVQVGVGVRVGVRVAVDRLVDRALGTVGRPPDEGKIAALEAALALVGELLGEPATLPPAGNSGRPGTRSARSTRAGWTC